MLRKAFFNSVYAILRHPVYFGKALKNLPCGAIVFFPIQPTVLNCGLAGIVTVKRAKPVSSAHTVKDVPQMLMAIYQADLKTCQKKKQDIAQKYLNGTEAVTNLLDCAKQLKRQPTFYGILHDKPDFNLLQQTVTGFRGFIEKETLAVKVQAGQLETEVSSLIDARLEVLKDALWVLEAEIYGNLLRIRDLFNENAPQNSAAVSMMRNINGVFNSINCLEVRGRDSAGISILFNMDCDEYASLREDLAQNYDIHGLQRREDIEPLLNNAISVHDDGDSVTLVFTYKIAMEIGSLGDNIRFLRAQIKTDKILQCVIAHAFNFSSVTAHTRWASIGAITEANCHPVGNLSHITAESDGIIHACLNGDIDNYLELKTELEGEGCAFPQLVTTDTQIIPLLMEKYIKLGQSVEQAFLSAVNRFEGSHAISVQTSLDPGKVFLAQHGSGQAVFLGMAERHYIPSSEVYGFIEETNRFIKMDGEAKGQIFVINQNSPGGLAGLRAFWYDGSHVELTEDDIKTTELSGRDIDRQGFAHYFLKEISEAPESMERTLHNRWKINPVNQQKFVNLTETQVPKKIRDAFKQGKIKKIYCVGQGTAGVAAGAIADIMRYYLGHNDLYVDAMKASELSGFFVNDEGGDMSDTLVIAISQSGTTADTNRAVDMVTAQGAHTLCIVNRRDSDLTFKTDGTIYTSSGRDIEMSVASTKAFYSQIVAGCTIGLFLAQETGTRDGRFVNDELECLLTLPTHMRKVLEQKEAIKASADRLASTKTYWAVVGSGPNKVAADEIRIKLSELCYKTISADFVEDKKHIDLSSEPLIIVCGAGSRGSVIGDIVKDTAIFKAHKSATVVIADEDEMRFDPYADSIFKVPAVTEHLAPIMNTLAGHIWGYYAALSINNTSLFLQQFREELLQLMRHSNNDVYEMLQSKRFREVTVEFYRELRQRQLNDRFPSGINNVKISDMLLLLKYMSGSLPFNEFELDFDQKGTAAVVLDMFFATISQAISFLARPIDAIKHQAKTVTVGTSRLSDKLTGIIFDYIVQTKLSTNQITNSNIVVLKNLQPVLENIDGMLLYKIEGLDSLGNVTNATTIQAVQKFGGAAKITSRTDIGIKLSGSKNLIIQRGGNVYIGKGRKDARSILVIPVLSAEKNRSNVIDYLILLHISIKESLPVNVKVKALGGKFDHIKNIVEENIIVWDDNYLDFIKNEDLFGYSAEKIAEDIIAYLNQVS